VTSREERKRGVTLRLELFVDDLPISLDFYVRVLGFVKAAERPGGYTPLARDAVHLALNLRADLPDGHPIQRAARERPGQGVEIVLEVDDIEATYQHVVSEKWPRSAELMPRPWGLTDFRLLDPDGYYWRVTSRE
jgi:lactoylglutathione lyase